MKTAIFLIAAVYVAGFVLTVSFHTQMPTTPSLAWVRSFLWPIWLAGGLRGAPMPMD